MISIVTTPHYPTRAARSADLIIHVVGLAFAVAGAVTLIRISPTANAVAATAIYSVSMVAMLSFSLAYNSCDGRRKPLLRRLDHAGIFLMIAGSYTPFTTLILTGAWAIGMTFAVWAFAGLGILAKLFLKEQRKVVWVTLYLVLSWMVLVAVKPILAILNWPAAVLLLLGGVIYSSGAVFYMKQHLNFSRPIWHGHVVAGAGVHWAAILIGAVLPSVR